MLLLHRRLIAFDHWANFVVLDAVEPVVDTQVDADLSRVLAYAPTQHAALGDILMHIPVHGQHHRGQINAGLQAAGITPPSIDSAACHTTDHPQKRLASKRLPPLAASSLRVVTNVQDRLVPGGPTT